MGVVVPIVLFAGLVVLVLAAPRFPAFRGRRRARVIATELIDRHGFSPQPDFGLGRLPLSGPPFHYGDGQEVESQVAGAVDGLTAVVAGYCFRYNGSALFHGVVLVSLPEPVARIEVRHEPAFHSVRVVEPVPAGRARTGIAPFDERHETYVAEPSAVGCVLPEAAVRDLVGAPERFSWRAEGRELLLWKSGGWASADSLLASLRAVTRTLRPEAGRPAAGQDQQIVRAACGPYRRRARLVPDDRGTDHQVVRVAAEGLPERAPGLTQS